MVTMRGNVSLRVGRIVTARRLPSWPSVSLYIYAERIVLGAEGRKRIGRKGLGIIG
jgi:hypothetical protein